MTTRGQSFDGRYLQLHFLGDTEDLEVKFEHDPDAKTISITGTDTRTSKADLINNLRTVAKKLSDPGRSRRLT